MIRPCELLTGRKPMVWDVAYKPASRPLMEAPTGQRPQSSFCTQTRTNQMHRSRIGRQDLSSPPNCGIAAAGRRDVDGEPVRPKRVAERYWA